MSFRNNLQPVKRSTRIVTTMLFGLYLFILFEIIVFKMHWPFEGIEHFRSLNFIPYKQIPRPVNMAFFTRVFANFEMRMNVIVFIPMGIYVQMLFPKWWAISKLALIAASSVLLEALQYIWALGYSDITDVIHNTLGGFLGLLLMGLLMHCILRRNDLYTAINAIASLGTVSMMMFLSETLLWR